MGKIGNAGICDNHLKTTPSAVEACPVCFADSLLKAERAKGPTDGKPPRMSQFVTRRMVIAVMRTGKSLEESAVLCGLSPRSVEHYTRDHPEFREELEEARKFADASVVKSLHESALGGNVTAMIFWLKNRDRANWRDVQDVEHGGKVSLEELVLEAAKRGPGGGDKEKKGP